MLQIREFQNTNNKRHKLSIKFKCVLIIIILRYDKRITYMQKNQTFIYFAQRLSSYKDRQKKTSY